MRKKVNVAGIQSDAETRCQHYNGINDVLAIRLKCCTVYYSCRECHDELSGHTAQTWDLSERQQFALYCGRCQNTFSIDTYLNDPFKCPTCKCLFNPNCVEHHHLYFNLK